MKLFFGSLAALAGAAALFGGAAAAEPAPELAITFDDLPVHSALPPGETRLDVAQKIIAALKAAGVPSVYGFVNGAQIEREPASAEVLPAWRAAGYPLGNHTWSHLNLNTRTAADFETEVLEDEPILKAQMGKGDWRWLRYPYLSEGDTLAKKVEVRRFLAKHGYRIADVTMSFGDYAYNDPYARCAAKGDQAAIAGLEKAYLEGVEQSIAASRRLSKAVYGRDIPYVLLMHIGAFDARMLPKVLEIYRAHGFRFVTLKQAERDPFYRADLNLTLPPQEDLEGVAAAHGVKLPHLDDGLAKLDQVCR